MRTIVMFNLIWGLVLISSAALAEPVLNEQVLREECSAHAQAGMRDCLAAKVEASQQALKQAENTASSTLERWDEDSRYRRMAKVKLAKSNQEFTTFRETQCQFAASLTGGGAGNAHEMMRLACVATLNHQRALQLQEAISRLSIKK